MKKLFVIAAVCFVTACGSNATDGSDSIDTTPSDSASGAPADTSNAINPPLPDTARMMQDTNHVTGDTSSGRDSLSH